MLRRLRSPSKLALLRSLRLFAELPAPAIEDLAAALTPVEVSAGTVLIRQGEHGDAYYAIASGELDVRQDDHFCASAGATTAQERSPCCAVLWADTVTAHTPATVYRLNRNPS
jgi:hypothetical protein